MTPFRLIAAILAVLAATAVNSPAQQSASEAKLRETLRNTMLELRTAQTDKANLQATQATLEATNKNLTTELEALKKKFDALTAQSAADQTSARKEITELTSTLATRDADLAKHQQALTKWRIAYQQVLGIAKKKEEARAAAVQRSVELERQVSAQTAKNVALYKLGDEILTRYKNFGLGEAIAAREPFTGLTRVKLENLAQEYKDKLLDQVIQP